MKFILCLLAPLFKSRAKVTEFCLLSLFKGPDRSIRTPLTSVPLSLSSRRRDSLSLPGGRQIGAHALEHFRRHADRFAQCRMRVDGLADVDRIASHLHGEADLADQVARMGADDAAAEQAVIGLIEQQFGESLVAPVG